MTRPLYRNVTADLVTPTTRLDWTTLGVLDAITANPNEVPRVDVDAAILARGGRVHLKHEAVKALRNMGYAIITHKGRHKSWTKLAGTPREYEQHRRHVIREGYSAAVTLGRELAGAVAAAPTDPVLADSHRHAQMTALALGTDPSVGKTVAEVIADLVPL